MIKCDVFVNQCREEKVPCCQGKSVSNCLFSSGWRSFPVHSACWWQKNIAESTSHSGSSEGPWGPWEQPLETCEDEHRLQPGCQPLNVYSDLIFLTSLHLFCAPSVLISPHLPDLMQNRSLLPFLSYKTFCFLHPSEQIPSYSPHLFFCTLSLLSVLSVMCIHWGWIIFGQVFFHIH